MIILKIIGIMYFLGVLCVLTASFLDRDKYVYMQSGYKFAKISMIIGACMVGPITLVFYIKRIAGWIVDHVRSER